MANDPRISQVGDAANLVDVEAKHRLDTPLVSVHPVTGEWGAISPAQILDDSNKTLLGRYARVVPALYEASAVSAGQFAARFGSLMVHTNTPLGEILNAETIYVGDNEFDVSSVVSTDAPVYEFTGDWENLSTTAADWTDTYRETNFDESSVIAYENDGVASTLTDPELIWTASGGRVTTVSSSITYTLNAGKTFSNYKEIFITFDNHGSGSAVDAVNLCSSFPAAKFIVNNKIQFHTLNNWKELLIVNDTQFRINAGNGAAGVKEMWGW